MKLNLFLLIAASACVCGCASYQYRVTQPPSVPEVKDKQPVVVHYEPLEYRLSREHDRLLMQIFNLTDDRVVLVGSRSYVVDPRGESHPLRDRILGARSFTWMLLPPQPMTYAYPGYGYGWGPSWGWYAPYPGPWYGGAYFWAPPVYYAQVSTPYDWDWETGPVRLRLTYERENKFFEQNFEILREVGK